MSDKSRVGIVGVGRMGLAMLRHLIKHGHAVTACDLDTKQCDAARIAGADIAASPAELGKACGFVIIGVGYDDEVNEVALGAKGLLGAMQAGSIIAVSSTATPDNVKALDEKARAKGIDILDAPICRGRWAADEGTLLALVGGKLDVVERSRPIYQCFCSDIAHLGRGRPWSGRQGDEQPAALDQRHRFDRGGQARGLDRHRPADAARSVADELGRLGRAQRLGHDHLHWALKDMQIVAKMTDKAGLSLPITGAIKELVKDARRIKASNPPAWTGKKS
jgi:3-hydroxyisobutyrate dehydrogenase